MENNIIEPIKLFYKSDFEIYIKSDAGWGLPFVINFWSGNTRTRNYIAKFDGETWTNCHLVDDNTLHVTFDDHGLGLGQLYEQISYSFNNDCFRTGVDDEYLQPREVKAWDEDLQIERPVILDLKGVTAAVLVYALPLLAAEQERQKNENERKEAEAARVLAENKREEQEAKRETQEQKRIETFATNEVARQKVASDQRASEKQIFDTNEAGRISTFNTLKKTIEDWYSSTKNTVESWYASAKSAWDTWFASTKSAWTSWFDSTKSAWKTFNDAAATDENTRKQNEQTRISNENERKQNEQTRQSAETQRSNAESTRRSNEQGRVNAEQQRVINFDASQTQRDNTFKQSEQQRKQTFEDSQSLRDYRFGQSEQARQQTFEANEALRQQRTDSMIADGVKATAAANIAAEEAHKAAEEVGSGTRVSAKEMRQLIDSGKALDYVTYIVIDPDDEHVNAIYHGKNPVRYHELARVGKTKVDAAAIA